MGEEELCSGAETPNLQSWESLGDKEKALVISSFSKNLQFCRFFFETESEAPGPLFSLEYLPRSVITGTFIVLKRFYTFLLPILHIRSTTAPSVWTLHTGVMRKYNLKGSV